MNEKNKKGDMEDMKKFLPHTDTDKLKLMLSIREAYDKGDLTLEEARQQLKEKVVSLKPYEIALAEQQLKEFEDDQCRKEDIQKMLELFDGIIDTSRPELPDNHPVACYYRENDEMRKILLAIEDLVQYPVIKNQWLELYDRLAQFRLHLSRKQNQLYPMLEKKGFDRPTTTMWQLDDFIRDEIKSARQLLDSDKDDDFIAMQQTIVDDVRDLLQKEETVLYPTSLAMITPEEFKEMAAGDKEIGFAWIDEPETDSSTTVNAASTGGKDNGFAAELQALLGKYGYANRQNDVLDVATGKLSLEQINLIYRHMPVDLSFVDENDKVCFYTDTKHRIFPRSRNVIGRDVKNCHPRSSVHIVEEIISKFRSGEQDSAEFWINKPGLFIYITYTAVRDEQGRFRGVLERMQDCTHIRSLEGSQTLLTWGNNAGNETVKTDSQDEKAGKDEPSQPAETIDVKPETELKALFAVYPFLKGRMAEISPRFKMLTTPLARVMLANATVAKASEKSGVPVDELIAGIKRIIAEEQNK